MKKWCKIFKNHSIFSNRPISSTNNVGKGLSFKIVEHSLYYKKNFLYRPPIWSQVAQFLKNSNMKIFLGKKFHAKNFSSVNKFLNNVTLQNFHIKSMLFIFLASNVIQKCWIEHFFRKKFFLFRVFCRSSLIYYCVCFRNWITLDLDRR